MFNKYCTNIANKNTHVSERVRLPGGTAEKSKQTEIPGKDRQCEAL